MVHFNIPLQKKAMQSKHEVSCVSLRIILELCYVRLQTVCSCVFKYVSIISSVLSIGMISSVYIIN